MPIPFEFDFKNPDYVKVFKRRIEKLAFIRQHPEKIPALFTYYKHHIAQFIIDWGMTTNPRNIERGLPVSIPFLLFEKQEEFVNTVIDCWKNQRPLIVEKSRDMGVTWLCVATFCSLAIFNHGAVFGFGSRKEELVDKLGDLDSILEKGRVFLANLPREFRGGWSREKNSKQKLITIPETSSIIKGESGNNIGRGGRATGYCLDESAHVEQAKLIEASLSQTTNFRMDVSTPCGMGNVFAQKRFSGKYQVFTFHWRNDPRKDDAWYHRQQLNLDPITLAQEIDLDYSGSVDGVLIPSAWVQAAIDAHEKLGISKSGERIAALDVADEGADLNAICMRHGVVIEHIDDWSGKNSDILHTVKQTILICNEREYKTLYYDAEGIGAGVKGDARIIQEELKTHINVKSFRSSAAVWKPESNMVEGIKNEDMFANRKAQAWWQLRFRFLNTYRAVQEGIKCNPSSIISIPGNLKNLNKLQLELSQPTYSKNGAGKIIVNKKPDGAKSPNLADSVMMCYHDGYNIIKITQSMIDEISRPANVRF